MAGPESKLYTKLKKNNSTVYLHRIENTLSIGTPDVYFTYKGRGGMLELKVSSGKKKLSINYKPHQRVWARKHIEAGGLHYLAALHNGELLWWEGMAAVNPENHEPCHIGFEFP